MSETAIIQQAVEEHDPTHLFALFSGGHDSLCATAIAAEHPLFSGVVHINTGIGISETRDFVRETCLEHGWHLIEMHPDKKTYRDLVIEKGMPFGPKSHNTCYYWLKQRQVRRLIAEHKTRRFERIGLVTGIRINESVRRMESKLSTPIRRDGAQIWINPILHWTSQDCSDFMEKNNLKRNRVVDLLHRSGECLCGAYSNWWEIKDIRLWYPDTAAEIASYEQLARENGHVEDVWAGRVSEKIHRDQQRFDLPMCQSCQVPDVIQ